MTPLTLAAGPAQSLTFPPTVQRLAETSVTIHGGLTVGTGSARLVVTADGEPARSQMVEPVFRAVFDDLTPATTYRYQVLAGASPLVTLDGSIWGPSQFTTPPYNRPLRVAAIGDTGWGDNITRQLAAHMAAQNPHLLLHLGDALYRSATDFNGDPFANWWHKYYTPFAPALMTAPHSITFGNHDIESRLNGGMFSFDAACPPPDADSGGRWHSFLLENIRFICLDSQVYFSFPDLIAAQEAWLDDQLANPQGVYTVVYFHVSPYQSSSEHQSSSALMASVWGWRFDQSGHVRLVLSGHVHAYERLHVDGVTYVIAGGGGSALYGHGDPHPGSAAFVPRASYALLDLAQDGFTITAFNIAGHVIDSARVGVA